MANGRQPTNSTNADLVADPTVSSDKKVTTPFTWKKAAIVFAAATALLIIVNIALMAAFIHKRPSPADLFIVSTPFQDEKPTELETLPSTVSSISTSRSRTSVSFPPTITTPRPHLEVRLSGGAYSHIGRLEVKNEGVWGAVCGDFWDKKDAFVVCHQLGFRNYSDENILFSSDYVSTPSPDIVWIKDVQCNGSEVNLGLCDYKKGNLSRVRCPKAQDVVMSCQPLALEDTTTTTLAATTSNVPTIPLSTTTTTTSTTTSTTTTVATTTTALPVAADAVVSILFGETINEGLLVITMAGVNYTVCDDHWNSATASVVCAINGYTEVVSAIVHSPHYNESLFQIFPSHIICNGNESSLSECSFEAIGTCFHHDDVLIACGPIPTSSTISTSSVVSTSTTTPSTEAVTTGTSSSTSTSTSTFTSTIPTATTGGRDITERAEVRLVGGDGDYVGRLEVKINDTWGTVCAQGWKEVNARVVCSQLHYLGVDRYRQLTERGGVTRGEEDQIIWLRNIDCVGTEEYLTACKHELSDWRCSHTEDIMMSCTDMATPAPPVRNNGDIWLNPGPGKGRLEIYTNNQHGIVCGEEWNRRDAVVACQQLGFSGVASHTVPEYSVDGEPPYLISQVNCNGTESSLLDCTHLSDDSHVCDYGFWSNSPQVFIECNGTLSLNSTVEARIRLSGDEQTTSAPRNL